MFTLILPISFPGDDIHKWKTWKQFYQMFTMIKAKFHYTDPTGPAQTLSETRTDPTEFLGAAKKSVRVRAGPCSGI